MCSALAYKPSSEIKSESESEPFKGFEVAQWHFIQKPQIKYTVQMAVDLEFN